MSHHINLGLVFHMHQPVGNYDHVFAELFERSYEPIIAALERHPGIKAGLHYSGPLIDWLAAHRPAYFDRISALLARGQVELLGGGYYEPILPAVSPADRHGQLALMTSELERRFGVRPSGAWIAERVWAPDLPATLRAAGYEWTLVDDVHFQASGFDPDSLPGWYLTEYGGETTGIFASSTQFRYLVPWGTVDDCIDYLRNRGDRHPDGLVVMGDDGEKFGGWPTTFAHCWEFGWVDQFFTRLEAEGHWIGSVLLGEWQRERPAAGLAYLPSASYMEMGEWSLPPHEQLAMERAIRILREAGAGELTRFVRGSHWANFLARYPEANLLHKRLLHLSRDAHASRNIAALQAIWKAQCNCPYWHGVFGGVYLEHIRDANESNMAVAAALLHAGPGPADTRDWDFDGRDEVCLSSADHTVVIDPADSAILHWELPRQGWHLTHVVACRPEAYHEGLHSVTEQRVRNIHDAVRVKDPRVLEQPVVYDRLLRLAAQDSLASDHASWKAARGEAPSVVAFEHDDASATWSCTLGEASYAKRLTLDSAGLRVELRSDRPIASEWNLSLPWFGDGGPPGFTFEQGRVRIATPRFTLTCRHDAAGAWVEPVHSISNTEDGVEFAPQGWCLVFAAAPADKDQWNLSLAWSVD